MNYRRILFFTIQTRLFNQIKALSSSSSSSIPRAATLSNNSPLRLREIRVDLSPHIPQPILAFERQNLDDDESNDAENDLLTQALMDDNEETYHGILGAQAWPSGFVAAKYLLQFLNDGKTQQRTNNKVLELGCGTGIPSLAALASGKCKSVVATDLDVSLVTHAASLYTKNPQNEQHNSNTRFQARKLNLLDEKAASTILNEVEPDIVAAADCLYDETLSKAVGKIAGMACRNFNCTVIVSDPNRLNGKGRQNFLDAFLNETEKEKASLAGKEDTIGHVGRKEKSRFVDVHTPQDTLKGAGASLSWCGVDETSVGVFCYPTKDDNL